MDPITDIILLALAGIAGYGVYEYTQGKTSTATTQPATQSSSFNAQQTNPQTPPYLYDPLIDLLPKQTVSSSNPAVSVAQSAISGSTNTSNGVTNSLINSSISNANAVTNTSLSNVTMTRQQAVNQVLSSLNTNYSISPTAAVNEAASNISSLIGSVGPITPGEFGQLSYSSGPSGVATIPQYNSQGQIIGVSVLNNATNNGSTTNVITSNPASSPTNTYYSASSVAAQPNAVIGYSPLGPGNTPVYSIGSAYSGPGSYMLPGGGMTYLTNAQTYNQVASTLGLGASATASASTAPASTASVSASSPTPSVKPISQAWLQKWTNLMNPVASGTASKSTVSTTTTSTSTTTPQTSTVAQKQTPSSGVGWWNNTNVTPTTTVSQAQINAFNLNKSLAAGAFQNVLTQVENLTSKNLTPGSMTLGGLGSLGGLAR